MKRRLSFFVCLAIIAAVVATMSSCDLITGECNHNYVGEVTTDATCTEPGIMTNTCTKCGRVGYVDLNPTGHVEEVVEAVAPTCTEAGLTEGKKCSVCEAITLEQTEVPATGHTFVDGSCSVCGDFDPASQRIAVTVTDTYSWIDEITFVATEEGTYTFTVPAGFGICRKETFDSWGDLELDYQLNPNGGKASFDLEAGETLVLYVGGFTMKEIVIRWSFVAGEVDNGNSGNGSSDVEIDTELELGSNSIYVPAGAMGTVLECTFTVTNEGTYTFNSYSLMAVVIIDENTSHRGAAYLTPGTYTVNIVYYTSTVGYEQLTISYQSPSGGEPDGSEENPFVWDTIPEHVVIDYAVVSGKVYYVFTAPADCTIVFTWPIEGDSWFDYYELDANGDNTSNNESGYMATSHSIVVKAGKTYRVSLGSWSEKGSHTITVTVNSCDHEWSEATCAAPSTCAKCGITTGEVTEHSWVEDLNVEATCTKNGRYESHCTECNLTNNYDIEASGHYNIHLTCGQSGQCAECDTMFTLEHKDANEDGECDECNVYLGE